MKKNYPGNTLEKLKELLPQLEDKYRQKFLNICTYTKLKNKDIVISEGNTTKKASFILSGIVRGFIVTDKGEEKTILLRGKGIFVAYPDSVFHDVPAKYNYESIGETELLAFKSEDFEALANREEAIKNLYLGILKEAVSVLNYRVETMITMNNEERYIDLVKRNPEFLKSTYKKDIANYLGITPVSLSRIIKRIK
ncbi:MAG: Crp/Fnr family transcriptional regulator [Flavobacteriaceae bacterium]